MIKDIDIRSRNVFFFFTDHQAKSEIEKQDTKQSIRAIMNGLFSKQKKRTFQYNSLEE